MAALGLLCFACGRRRRPSRPRGVRAASGGTGGGGPANDPSAAAAPAADEVEDEEEEKEKESEEANDIRPFGVIAMEKGIKVASDDRVGGGKKRPTPSSRRPAPPSSSPSSSSANRLIAGESKARSVDQATKRREEERGRGGAEFGDQEQLDFSALTRAELLSATTNKDKVDCARRRTATQRRPPSKHALRRILSSDRHPDGSGDDDDDEADDAQLVATGTVGASANAAKRRTLLGAKSTALRVSSGQQVLPSTPVNYAPTPNLASGSGSTKVNRSSASDRKKRVESYGAAPRVAVKVGASAVNEGAAGAAAAAGSRRKYASQPLGDLGRIRAAPGDHGVAAFDSGADTGVGAATRRHLNAVLAPPPRASASQLSLSKMGTAADGLSAASASELDVAGATETTRAISPSAPSQLLRPASGDEPPETTSPTVSSPSDRQPGHASAPSASFGAATPAASAAIVRIEADQASSGSTAVPAAAVGTPGARTVVSLKQWTPLLSNAPARRTHGLRLYGNSVEDGGRRLMYASQPSLAATGNAASGKSPMAAVRLRSGTSLSWIAEPPPSAAAASGIQQRLADVGDSSDVRRQCRPTASASPLPPPEVDGPGRYGSRSHLPEAKTYELAAGRALLLGGGLAADMHPLGGQQDADGASPAGAASGYSTAPAPQRQLGEDISSLLVGQQQQRSTLLDGAREAASNGSLTAALGALSNGCKSSPKERRPPAPAEDETDRQSSGTKAEADGGGDACRDATMGDDAFFRRLTTTSTPPASPLSDGSGGVASSSAFGDDGGCGGDAWPSATPVSFSRSRLASAEIRMPESVAAGASGAAVRDRPPPPPPPAQPAHTPTPPATVGWRLARDDAPPATPSRRPPWWRPTRVAAAVDDDDEHVTAGAHRAPPRSRSVDQGLGKTATAAVAAAVLSQQRSATGGAAAAGAAAATAPTAAAGVGSPPPPQPIVRRSQSIAAVVSPTAAASASIPNWVLVAADKSRRLSRLFKEDAYGSTSALEGVNATATSSTVTSPPPSRPQVILHRGRVESAPAAIESALSQPPTPQADAAASAAKDEVWEQPAANDRREEVQPKCAPQLHDNDRCRSVAVADTAVIVDAESTIAVSAEKSAASSDAGRPQRGAGPDAVLPSAANGKEHGGGVQLRFGERPSLTNGVHLHSGAALRLTNGVDAAKLPADAKHRSASECQPTEVDVTRKFVTLRRSQSAAATFTRPSASSASGTAEEPEFVKLARARLARRREAGIITEEDDC